MGNLCILPPRHAFISRDNCFRWHLAAIIKLSITGTEHLSANRIFILQLYHHLRRLSVKAVKMYAVEPGYYIVLPRTIMYYQANRTASCSGHRFVSVL